MSALRSPCDLVTAAAFCGHQWVRTSLTCNSPRTAQRRARSQVLPKLRDFAGRALSWTLAVSGWEACGLSEAAQEASRDFHPIRVLPRDLKIGWQPKPIAHGRECV